MQTVEQLINGSFGKPTIAVATMVLYTKVVEGYDNRKAAMTGAVSGVTQLGIDLILNSVYPDQDIENIDFSTEKDAKSYMLMLISPLLNAVVGNYIYERTVRDNYSSQVSTWTNSKGMLMFGANEIVAQLAKQGLLRLFTTK